MPYAGSSRSSLIPAAAHCCRPASNAAAVPGPAEASGSIRPADVLLAVNGQDVSQLHFDDVIELLRSLGYGNVLLRFMRESRMQ